MRDAHRHGRRPLQGKDSRLGRRQRSAERRRHAARLAVAPRASATTTSPRHSSSHARPIPAPSCTTTTTTSRRRPAKRAGAIRIIKELQQRGLRIDAVGEQGHWRLDSPTTAEIDQTITELRATGVKVMITELDVNLLPPAAPPAPGQPRRPAANPYVERAAGRRAAGARALLRRRLPRLSEASRRHHARDVLGSERWRLVAQSRAHEPSAAVGSPATAEDRPSSEVAKVLMAKS